MLYEVITKPLEVSERRVAGAEVIERQPHSHGMESAQGLHRNIAVAHNDAFGDLEFEKHRFTRHVAAQIVDDGQQSRITSYNVCYTKLLRP